ncbi:MAG TPA: VOC family protein [Nocardioidaceae bacterium]|nr:VOC family protein [Nocardioidaceae bacterium]
MTSFVSHTTVDCADAFTLSEWWKQVLGYVDVEDDPNEPGHEECMILSPVTGHSVLFVEVPERKRVKNRLHFDLRPADGATREVEVERAVALGATQVADHRREDGGGWVLLADPEGNEFCILRSEAEVAAQTAASTP